MNLFYSSFFLFCFSSLLSQVQGEQLREVGNNGVPAHVFPLGVCQGDCDSNAECQPGLVCMQRRGNEPIPGCNGSPRFAIDFCVRPLDKPAPTPSPVPPTSPPQKVLPDPIPSPPSMSLVIKGNNGIPNNAFPLKVCEGDCDSNQECEGNLICFQRNNFEPVPGCTGNGARGNDYCIDPKEANKLTAPPTNKPITPTPAPIPPTFPPQNVLLDPIPTPPSKSLVIKGNNGIPNNVFPLKVCEGDCDSNQECEGDLVCFQRNNFEPVPGCTGNGVRGNDYCIDSKLANQPTNRPTRAPTAPNGNTLVFRGNNGVPIESFPLQMCQGDCDADRDCAGSLICFQRNNFEEVPGCTGRGDSGRDYCMDPKYTKAPTPRPTLAPHPQGKNLGDPNYRFKMRLYWSIDWYWQETKRETWWCMECARCNGYTRGDGHHKDCQTPGNSGDSCRDGHNIWIRKCQDNRDYQFNILKNPGSGDQVRVHGTNLCLSTVGIHYLEVKNCDKNSSTQLFKPISSLDRFELRPYHMRNWSLNDARCVSQHHHPKDKEVVGLWVCKYPKGDGTMWWEEYHP